MSTGLHLNSYRTNNEITDYINVYEYERAT